MTAWIWPPEKGFERQVKATVRVTQFGDGYEQRQAQGINAIKEQVPMTFSWRSVADIRDMEAFLIALGGVGSFTWTAPDGITRKYTCREWTVSENTGVYASLSATWIQVFEA
jgi:phage-related protein